MTVQQYLIIHAAELLTIIAICLIVLRIRNIRQRRRLKKYSRRRVKDLAIQYDSLYEDVHFPITGIKDRTDELEKKIDTIDKVIFLSENALHPRIQELEKLVKELQQKA